MAFLLGRTLEEIGEMSYSEYQGWMAYFEARPVGWRDDNRIMPLIQCQGVKAQPGEIFPSLAAISRAAASHNKKIEETIPEGLGITRNLENSVMFQNLLGAVGGDVIPGMEKS